MAASLLRPLPSAVLRLNPRTARRCNVVVLAASKKPKQQPQKKQKSQKRSSRRQRSLGFIGEEDDDDDDDEGDRISSSGVVLVPGVRAPRAPAPADTPSGRAPRPEDLYPVFPPRQSAAQPLPRSSAPWAWGPDAPSSSSDSDIPVQETPMWNPKTGFMKTRQQVEAEEQAAKGSGGGRSAASPRLAQPLPAASSGMPQLTQPLKSLQTQRPAAALQRQQSEQQQSEQQQQQQQQQSSPEARLPLPSVSRERVLASCAGTTAAMLAGAAALHAVAGSAAQLWGTDAAAVARLSALPSGLTTPTEVGWMMGAAVVVSAARAALLQASPAFAAASERSNAQVLSPLTWPDALAVAAAAGVSEELLFRGGVIPVTLPDGRGVLLSAAIFGALHVTGGRNAVFAVWAGAVGALYGAAFVATGNVWVPAGAHAIANAAAAAAWLSAHRRGGE